jgi:hypothetical protein
MPLRINLNAFFLLNLFFIIQIQSSSKKIILGFPVTTWITHNLLLDKKNLLPEQKNDLRMEPPNPFNILQTSYTEFYLSPLNKIPIKQPLIKEIKKITLDKGYFKVGVNIFNPNSNELRDIITNQILSNLNNGKIISKEYIRKFIVKDLPNIKNPKLKSFLYGLLKDNDLFFKENSNLHIIYIYRIFGEYLRYSLIEYINNRSMKKSFKNLGLIGLLEGFLGDTLYNKMTEGKLIQFYKTVGDSSIVQNSLFYNIPSNILKLLQEEINTNLKILENPSTISDFFLYKINYSLLNIFSPKNEPFLENSTEQHILFAPVLDKTMNNLISILLKDLNLFFHETNKPAFYGILHELESNIKNNEIIKKNYMKN